MQLITKIDKPNTYSKEALTAWIDRQATGLHLTGKEVQDWQHRAHWKSTKFRSVITS